MTEFRNAYGFVPRKAPDPAGQRRLPDAQRDYGLGATAADGHAVYAAGTRSGRITCRVTLEGPTVIGGLRHSGEGLARHAVVEPFLFRGRPALPATSLKGMISSIAESVARAPYRVLQDMKLTVAFGIPPSRERHSKGSPASTRIGTTHDYFDPTALPLQIGGPRATRSMVNPVEAMFGFLRDVPEGAAVPKGQVVGAAGKLRFGHALPSGTWADTAARDFFVTGDHVPATGRFPPGVRLVRLKEQAQPMKQPPNHPDLRSATPNFYFVTKVTPDEFIAKRDFATRPPADYAPQGGKFYLHHPDAATGEPWKTADTRATDASHERKAAVAILQRGVTFDFRIDFDNLSPHEIAVLCYALRPSARFRHKIGLGRALGLGSIRIDVCSLVTVDRAARYTAGALFDDDPRQAADAGSGQADATAHRDAHDAWLTQNDPAARRALLAIGETHAFDDEGAAQSQPPVLWVPLTEPKYQALTAVPPTGAVAAEDRSFKWFVENDREPHGWKQKLRAVGAGGRLAVLTTDGAAPVTAPAAPARPRAAAAGRGAAPVAGEVGGRLKFCKRDAKGNYFAILVPDAGGADVFVNHLVCIEAGLTGARKKALLVFVQGAGNTAARVRLR